MSALELGIETERLLYCWGNLVKTAAAAFPHSLFPCMDTGATGTRTTYAPGRLDGTI